MLPTLFTIKPHRVMEINGHVWFYLLALITTKDT